MSAKRYLTVALAIAAGALVVTAGFNALVDPFGAYPQTHLVRFEPMRQGIFNRIARAELARRGDWDMIILGTSRPKAGLPRHHPAFATNRVCNLSADAAYMVESAAVFDFARERNPIRRVLLCLDFALSRSNRLDRSDFKQSRFNPELSIFQYHCKNLIGAGASDRSLEFVQDFLRGRHPPEEQRDGFFVHGLRKGSSQRTTFARGIRTLAYGYAMQRIAPDQMAAFRHVLATCRENNIELTLAINPVHALDLELLRAAGNWERFEQWKRDVVQMVEEELPGTALWDFTGYWTPTAEEVPAADDTTTRMKYYFENSHYTPAMGGLMLDRMYGGNRLEFGAMISTANVKAHLELIRKQREAYAESHAGEIRWVQEIVSKAFSGRRPTAALADELE